jgi:hypothetical protein
MWQILVLFLSLGQHFAERSCGECVSPVTVSIQKYLEQATVHAPLIFLASFTT